MPVLVCRYCNKTYKVSQTRYDKAMSGYTNNPSCSNECKRILSTLTPRSVGRSTGIVSKKLF